MTTTDFRALLARCWRDVAECIGVALLAGAGALVAPALALVILGAYLVLKANL